MPFAYIISLIVLWGVLMSILQKRKWGIREVEWFSQDSTGSDKLWATLLDFKGQLVFPTTQQLQG